MQKMRNVKQFSNMALFSFPSRAFYANFYSAMFIG